MECDITPAGSLAWQRYCQWTSHPPDHPAPDLTLTTGNTLIHMPLLLCCGVSHWLGFISSHYVPSGTIIVFCLLDLEYLPTYPTPCLYYMWAEWFPIINVSYHTKVYIFLNFFCNPIVTCEELVYVTQFVGWCITASKPQSLLGIMECRSDWWQGGILYSCPKAKRICIYYLFTLC